MRRAADGAGASILLTRTAITSGSTRATSAAKLIGRVVDWPDMSDAADVI